MTSLNSPCPCGSKPPGDVNQDYERCCMVWAIAKVEEMRSAQRNYFRTKSSQMLEQSKALEHVVDKVISKLKSGGERTVQQQLF